jgi:hypothetical protein
MRPRVSFALICAALLLVVPAAHAQRKEKPKDPVMQAYLEEMFAEMNSKLVKLSDRLTAMEEDLNKIKQAQAASAEEGRASQNLMRNTDMSLSSFRVSAQQDILSLKSDLARIKEDISSLAAAKKAEPPAPAPDAGSAAAPKVEGYITAVTKDEVTINLGSGAGMKVGTKLNVFRSSDARTQIGVIEIVEVLDANNSRARISFHKPDTAFEFSDIVRP